MNYSNIFGSNFPNEVIPVGTKKDIDDSVMDLIKEYYDYIDSGNLTEAANLYNNNKELLEPYSCSAIDYNRWQEELYNLGVAVLNETSTIISDNEPATQSIDSHWLLEY